MEHLFMNNKSVLAVDSQTDVLQTLEEQILGACPGCRLDTATTFEDGRDLMLSIMYDLVISDIIRAPGSNLVDVAVSRKFPVLVLSDNNISPEGLNRFAGLRIKAVLPKENLANIVPIIKQVLRLECVPAWRGALDKLVDSSASFVSRLSPKNLDGVYRADKGIFY
jgi:hypothetical protein